MGRKRKIDFLIENYPDERLIFRFYPRRSSCHSFDKIPPTSWDEVYKVYYSYAIIKQYKFNEDDKWESVIMFKEDCDECSIIDEVGTRCLELAKGYETFERDDGERIPLLDKVILPFGMGTNWTISKRVETDFEDKTIKHTYYNFTLFNYDNRGFRFTLKEENMKNFGEYLCECCEYMLQYGESI